MTMDSEKHSSEVGDITSFPECLQADNPWMDLNIPEIKRFLNQLEQLLVIFKEFSEEVVAHVNSAVEKINSLDNDEQELREAFRECKEKLSNTQDKAALFKDRVVTFFKMADTGEDETMSIKASLECNDVKPLMSHLKMLTCYLEECNKFYQDFQTAYSKAEELCKKILNECNEKKNTAKNRKYAARGIGAGAAIAGVGGVVGGGVALSVAAGFFTFGIGTAVGLVITSAAAAGSIAAGVGVTGVASVGSHLLARNFDKIQTTFQGICDDLNSIKDNITDLGTKMSKLNALFLQPVQCNKKNVQEDVENEESVRQLCRSFEILQEGIKQLRQGNTVTLE